MPVHAFLGLPESAGDAVSVVLAACAFALLFLILHGLERV